MFGKPKDDLQEELEKYEKPGIGTDSNIYENNNQYNTFNTGSNMVNTSAKRRISYNNVRLDPDESIIWEGKSCISDSQSVGVKFFGVFWLGFAIIWTILACTSSVFMGLFGIPFIIIGIMLVTGKFAPGRYQIITNKRIITFGKHRRTVHYSEITDLSYNADQDGTGTLIFRSNFGYSNSTISGVQNVEQVYNAMCEAIRDCQK